MFQGAGGHGRCGQVRPTDEEGTGGMEMVVTGSASVCADISAPDHTDCRQICLAVTATVPSDTFFSGVD